MTLFAAIRVMSAFLLLGVACAHAQDTEQMIRDAVALHDQGDLDGAMAMYRRVLDLDPDNLTALYELALSQQVSGDYPACVESARRALAVDSANDEPAPFRSTIFSMQASCHSANGEIDDALEIFTAGLEEFPDDYSLNFNIAITLTNTGRADEARVHLKRAIEAESWRSSPYYVLGVSYVQSGRTIQGLISLLSFITMEYSTDRSVLAARQVIHSVLGTAGTDESGAITIFADPTEDGDDDGDYGALNLMLSVTVVASSTDGELNEPYADTLATILQNFQVQLIELRDEKSEASFPARYLEPPLVELHAAGVAPAFARFVVYLAGVEGAESWLESNPEAVDGLVEFLNRDYEPVEE